MTLKLHAQTDNGNYHFLTNRNAIFGIEGNYLTYKFSKDGETTHYDLHKFILDVNGTSGRSNVPGIYSTESFEGENPTLTQAQYQLAIGFKYLHCERNVYRINHLIQEENKKRNVVVLNPKEAHKDKTTESKTEAELPIVETTQSTPKPKQKKVSCWIKVAALILKILTCGRFDLIKHLEKKKEKKNLPANPPADAPTHAHAPVPARAPSSTPEPIQESFKPYEIVKLAMSSPDPEDPMTYGCGNMTAKKVMSVVKFQSLQKDIQFNPKYQDVFSEKKGNYPYERLIEIFRDYVKGDEPLDSYITINREGFSLDDLYKMEEPADSRYIHSENWMYGHRLDK